MSLVIPSLQYYDKFYVENHVNASIVQNTWYTALLNTVSQILYWIFEQTNTTPQNQDVEYRITIDGEVMEGATVVVPGAYDYIYTEAAGISPAMGENPYINMTTAITAFGLFSTNSGAGVHSDNLRGHSVLLEYRITDVPGANQTVKCDIWYQKQEAVG